MGRPVYYHHPCADNFSLTFSSESVADIVEQWRENHCIGFAEEILERAERAGLADSVGPSQADFVEYLETGIVERDFTTLF